MINKNPSIFRLKTWREENGFTTEEWQIYVKKMNDICGIALIWGIFWGIVAGIIIGIDL